MWIVWFRGQFFSIVVFFISLMKLEAKITINSIQFMTFFQVTSAVREPGYLDNIYVDNIHLDFINLDII